MRERARQEDGGSRRSVQGPAALHLPLLIASRGRRGRTWGGDVGLTTLTPHDSRLLRIKCEPKLPHGTCGRFRDTKDPRLGRGADVAGPLPAATSRHARGVAGFPATWHATARGRPAARCTSPRVPASRLQKNSTKGGAPAPRPAPSCRLVTIGS